MVLVVTMNGADGVLLRPPAPQNGLTRAAVEPVVALFSYLRHWVAPPVPLIYTTGASRADKMLKLMEREDEGPISSTV